MKTFLTIFGVIEIIIILIFIVKMLQITPKFNRGINRFNSNCREGGGIVLIVYTILNAIISLGITMAYLCLNFLEK